MRALSGFLCAATVSAQQTWIVDPNDTGHFTDIGAAITAALLPIDRPALTMTGGHAVVSASWFFGGMSQPTVGPSGCSAVGLPAIQLSGGDLTVVESLVRGAPRTVVHCGGRYTGYSQPGPAAVVTGGTVRFRSCDVSGAQSVVHGSLPVYHDPATTFSPPLTAGIAIFLPATLGMGAAPGGTMSCSLWTNSNQPAALAASLGRRSPVTTSYGATWLAPNQMVVLAIGVTNGIGRLAASIPLPATAPRGLPITVQGVAAPVGSGNLQAATPVVLHVH